MAGRGAWDCDEDIPAGRLLTSETPANKALTLGLSLDIGQAWSNLAKIEDLTAGNVIKAAGCR